MTRITTALITNYKTRHLVQACYESVRRLFPEILIVVLDNGSNDESTAYISSLACDLTRVILNPTNLGHGLAMDLAIRQMDSEWVWTIDSDIEILKPRLLEDMYASTTSSTYATGWLRYVDKYSGVPADWFLGAKDNNQFIKYIHPCCAMYRISTYITLRPFIHHGAPCLHNMQDANSLGLGLHEFPVFEYIKHWIGGTRRMFDTASGDWDPNPTAIPKKWDPNANLPI